MKRRIIFVDNAEAALSFLAVLVALFLPVESITLPSLLIYDIPPQGWVRVWYREDTTEARIPQGREENNQEDQLGIFSRLQ